MTRRACPLIILLALLLAPAARSAAAQEQPSPIIVEGRILNGATGAPVSPGLDVFLVSSQGPERETVTTTGEDGQFRFEATEPPPGARLGVSVQYQGAIYGAIVQVGEGRALPMTITVHEASQDQLLIHAASASLLLARADKSTQTLWALEIVKLVNSSDRTYVPGPGPMQLLRFGLPPGAADLTVDTALIGADVLQVDRGFALTAAVPPGEHEVMYAYSLPYHGAALELAKSLPYGAGGLRILVPQDVAALTSEAGQVQRVTIGSAPYQLLEGKDVPRGSKVRFSLDALPQAGLGDRARQTVAQIPLEYAAIVGLGLVMTALLGFALLARSPDPRTEAPTDRARLIHDLARLDAEFDAGEIDPTEYQRVRASLSARITSLGNP